MATVRHGAAVCMSDAAERAQLPEETDEKGNCDPDKLLQCPFDKNHLIRSCRFPYHLIKCRKNHPKLASELQTCPFNARHLVPKDQLKRHTETCEDRISVHPVDGETTEAHCRWQVPLSTWVVPNMSEDWDKEADNAAAPFVWGVSTSLNPKLETLPTNNLSPGFRAPNLLPWNGFKP
ncbi:gametocyte-specific factor 1 [Mastacembelus armatus]|uniref:CHHC U11-48K-type domain-containing protein n=1 Tax=Mastacembelus armatus TaxID=205130 RepID=A0A3Q3KME3_9TELE|nr:gametocyte-specific factor 1-like [Mastacembelus armatus]XP_026188908.1 gametocyte-specific factor 1-like [Mastacembelus armatus]